MTDETYDDERARNLEELLRQLARRIFQLDAGGALLSDVAELQRLLGDVRSELFHYEVRSTYDTPDVAESRRIVAEAADTNEETWQSEPWSPDEENRGDE